MYGKIIIFFWQTKLFFVNTFFLAARQPFWTSFFYFPKYNFEFYEAREKITNFFAISIISKIWHFVLKCFSIHPNVYLHQHIFFHCLYFSFTFISLKMVDKSIQQVRIYIQHFPSECFYCDLWGKRTNT